jgi:hypothetical protein
MATRGKTLKLKGVPAVFRSNRDRVAKKKSKLKLKSKSKSAAKKGKSKAKSKQFGGK